MTTTTHPGLVSPAPQRLSLRDGAPAFYRAMLALDNASATGLDPALAQLVRARASQLNGCAYCVDTHSHDAKQGGERDHRLFALTVWRETPFFTARERAALALVEAITLLPTAGVPDDVFDAAALVFEPAELAQLIALAVTINAWNRIGVATRMSPAPRDGAA